MPWARENIAHFRTVQPEATIVELKECDHYCFISREEEMATAIRVFPSVLEEKESLK